MKFVPTFRDFGAPRQRIFCIEVFTHAPDDDDICAECGKAGPTYCHMGITSSNTVALCRDCYEAYLPLAGLVALTGA